ncbi:hypothetical protein THMIRHAS_23080 [Thiosulfatimonas sediminis]|uniref:HPP transmembrane region domain-containing protein n=1 Tax=Thiosulfatimonas sediminis TaxID=2675054 RepID=A0A6F8PXS5_9GAMM|nr:HPP family protein [Thiosulfatimonas sediminis]BBP46935.1 hypothetical protein THMIRHAS_23080 [Thiosulfatimonas sediminis]
MPLISSLRANATLNRLYQIAAPTHINNSLSEKLYSALGGFIGIFAVAIISHHWAPAESIWLITASMGASAVLLFAAPHGPMSQPWPLLGGHLISALIGILFALYALPLLDPLLVMGLSVSLSIFAMYALGCLHPPGGATALTVILGAISAPSSIGFDFLLFPVLLNVLVILMIAVFFHSLSQKKYPVYFASEQSPIALQHTGLSHEEFLSALSKIDSFVDINEQELRRILELTQIGLSNQALSAANIANNRYYSNGELGKNWSVRQVIEVVEEDFTDGEKQRVIFKQKAGYQKLKTDCIALSEFIEWAAYEVEPAASGWQKKQRC